MAYILHVDTSQSTSFVGISKSGNLLLEKVNIVQNQHAAFLHGAIESMLNELHISLMDIAAFGIVSGPGSYTGLRIGMSAVKGFCYATHKPMLTTTSLKALCKAAIKAHNECSIFVPMVDARRLEVFTAAYRANGEEVLKPQSLTLHSQSFENDFLDQKVLFCGSGFTKWEQLCGYANNYVYSAVEYDNHVLAEMFYEKFTRQKFSDLTYSDAFYIKDFYKG